MTSIARFTVSLAAASALLVSTSLVSFAQEKKASAKCVMAGGEATMITKDLAEFMAGAALKNSISGMGAKPVGQVKMTCKDGTMNVYCLAKQQACK